ncbi:hypothetical protein SESBI_48555 [Sesbania bispinosa]|nr:hypothetical protein SESBI_48555 [Sesbania bispinosa]
MLEDFSGHVLVRDVTDIKTPMELIFEELCKIGAIKKKRDSRKGAMCAIHPDVEHSIEKCEKFREVLQSLIDSQLVQISCIRDEGGVNVVQESENAQTQAFPKKLRRWARWQSGVAASLCKGASEEEPATVACHSGVVASPCGGVTKEGRRQSLGTTCWHLGEATTTIKSGCGLRPWAVIKAMDATIKQ